MEKAKSPIRMTEVGALSALVAIALIGLAGLQFALWLVQYLTWPWWADHDVFATMAQAWSAGQRPYRDLVSNNFPGAIYEFWVVGKLAGWGNVVAYNAFDAVLLAVLGMGTLVWSQRRFASLLPGAVTLYALGAYYFDLDFSLVAQRDWHAGLFVALAMIVLEVMPGALGPLVSALLTAIGFSIRPQVLMFVPGLVWGAWTASSSDLVTLTGGFRRSAVWLAGLGVAIVLVFSPLLYEGLVRDLAQGVAAVIPGTSYYVPRGYQLWTVALRLGAQARVWALFPALAVLWPVVNRRTRRSVINWLLLLAGSLAYLAITPFVFPYVYHPFWLLWAFLLGVLTAMVRQEALERSWSWRAAAVVLFGLAMVLDVGDFPSACRKSLVKPALRALRAHQAVAAAPVGYTHRYGTTVNLPPWTDYQAALAYLRSELGPSTRVANALKGIAINGPTGRLPAFPAESVTWLFAVRPTDEERFIATIRACPDSVVVWDPDDTGATSVPLRFPTLATAIRNLYEPSKTFGPVAVWKRKTETSTGAR
jgi:hypothetical protein